MQCSRPSFDPWVRKIPWRRKSLPISVFLPEEFHGQRSLVCYSPRGCKEVYTTEWQRMHTQICTHFFTSMERMPFPPPLRLLLVVECEGVWRTLVGLALRVPALCSNVSDERCSWGLDLRNAGIRLKPYPQPESSKSIPAEPPPALRPKRKKWVLTETPSCLCVASLPQPPPQQHNDNNTMTTTTYSSEPGGQSHFYALYIP